MSQSFKIKLMSPTRQISEVDSESVIVPGKEGYMTLLPDHADMVSQLDIGHIELSTGGKKENFFVSGGFVQVEDGKVTVMADVLERYDDIDKSRAEDAKKRALERLDSQKADVDVDRASDALKRADVRVMIASTLAAASK